MGVHYMSDVVAGAVVGVIVALIGLQIHQPLLAWIVNLIGFALW
jgi:membrane-associated phospholipid phosphatase